MARGPWWLGFGSRVAVSSSNPWFRGPGFKRFRQLAKSALAFAGFGDKCLGC